VIAEFTLVYRFTGFFIRPAGPVPGAGRNEEKTHEGYEARPAPSSRRQTEGGASISLGPGYTSRRQADPEKEIAMT